MHRRFPMLLAPALLPIAALLALPGSAFAMSASFRWCSGSPEFRIGDVPRGTVRLDLRMTDLMVRSFHHGGGVVTYAGQGTIPCGALDGGYVGPSPPAGQVHLYRWTVKALDAAGKVLATATAERKFPE